STTQVGMGTFPYRQYVSGQPTQFAALMYFDGNYFARYAPIYQSPLLPVKYRDLFRVDLVGSGRLIIQCYDENDNVLTDSTAIWGIGLSWSATFNQFHIATGGIDNSSDTAYGTLFFNVEKDTVKKVSISITRSSTVGNEKLKFKIFKMIKPYENEVYVENGRNKQYYLTGSPNQGFADVGDNIITSDGLQFVCTKSTTYLTDDIIPISTNVIPISDTSDIQVGDIIALELSNKVAMWSRVTGVTSNTVTILNTTSEEIPAGRRFFVSRYKEVRSPNATTTVKGLVNQAEASADTATEAAGA